MNLPYIINVAVILLACLAFYKLLLRRETFYKVNRFFLIACLAISFALPLVRVPQQFSLRKTVSSRESIVGSQELIVKNNQALNEQQTGTAKQPTTDSQRQQSSIQHPESNI